MGESCLARVQTDWQNTSSGQIFPHVFASALDVFTTSAAPMTFPLPIMPMNLGMSICAGQASVQGASKHWRHRSDSNSACCLFIILNEKIGRGFARIRDSELLFGFARRCVFHAIRGFPDTMDCVDDLLIPATSTEITGNRRPDFQFGGTRRLFQ